MEERGRGRPQPSPAWRPCETPGLCKGRSAAHFSLPADLNQPSGAGAGMRPTPISRGWLLGSQGADPINPLRSQSPPANLLFSWLGWGGVRLKLRQQFCQGGHPSRALAVGEVLTDRGGSEARKMGWKFPWPPFLTPSPGTPQPQVHLRAKGAPPGQQRGRVCPGGFLQRPPSQGPFPGTLSRIIH